jgi:hypothetical protein
MKQLLILVKNPFSTRDYDRMGIAELSKTFEVTVLDCTAWLLPVALTTREPLQHWAKAENIAGAAQFLQVTRRFHGAFAIDYVGNFSISAMCMFWLLHYRGIGRCVIDSGNVPYPGHAEKGFAKWSSVLQWNLGGKHFPLLSLLKRMVTKVMYRVIRPPVPEFAFVAGSSCMASPLFSQAKTIVTTHSFDAEQFIALNRNPPKFEAGYAVYLDEKITHHEDNQEMGIHTPASDEHFLPALRRFFDHFEQQAGIPVVIAAYPSSNRDVAAVYGRRKWLLGETAELLRNAKIVFAHGSTATSFAILWRRPLVHIVNSELEESWYYPWIKAMSLNSGAPILSVDGSMPAEAEISKWLEVDNDKYRHYEETFIRARDDSGKPLWEVVADSLKRAP